MSADYPGAFLEKTTVLPLRPVRDFLVRPFRSIVCPSLCFEGQARVQSLEMIFPLPEGFNGDESGGLLVARDCEAAREVIRAPILHCLHCSLQRILVCVDRDTQHRYLSFVGTANVYAFHKGTIFCCCPFGGSATVLEDLTTMPTPSSSRRKEMALFVLDVTCIRPRDTASMYVKAPIYFLSSSLKRVQAPVGTPGRTLPPPRGPPAGFYWSMRSS